MIKKIRKEKKMNSITTTITITIAIIGCIMSVISFYLSRQDKTSNDTGKEAYERGKIDATLQSIMQKLDKIEKKLEVYDIEIETRVEKAIEQHIKEYHKGE